MPFKDEIVPHLSGWAILVAPTSTGAFATKAGAYEVCVDYARKLQCAGHSVRVHVQHQNDEKTVALEVMALPVRRQQRA
jgi:hypothetical protein